MYDDLSDIVYELEQIEIYLSKGSNKYKILATKLANFLIDTYSETEREVINNAIRYLSTESDRINKKDLDVVLTEIESKLGSAIFHLFRKNLADIQLKTYDGGHEDVGLKLEFNKTDVRCLKWLEKEISQFWIGDEYDEKLNQELRTLGQGILKEGLSSTEAGTWLSNYFSKKHGKTKAYYTLLANHTITRTREFSKVSAYEKADIEYVLIDAVDDEKTSMICRFLDGKLVPVSHLAEQRDKLMKAKTVEKIKELSPWWSKKKDIISKVVGKSSKKLPKSIGLPPYHGGCRTITVAALDKDVERDEHYNKVLESKEVRDYVRRYARSGISDAPKNEVINGTDGGIIHFYTSDYSKIRNFNKALRMGTADEFTKSLEYCLNNALSKLPDYKGKVFRYLQFDDQLDRLDFINRHKVGSIINYNTFSSSSWRKDTEYSDMNVVLRINSLTGKKVEPLSMFGDHKSCKDVQNQFEVLFNSKTIYIVDKIYEKGNRVFIDMTEKNNDTLKEKIQPEEVPDWVQEILDGEAKAKKKYESKDFEEQAEMDLSRTIMHDKMMSGW